MVTDITTRVGQPAQAAESTHAGLPRAALRADAAFCAVTGIVLAAAAEPITRLLGLEPAVVPALIGAGLIVYAAALWWTTTRGPVERRLVLTIALLNSAWTLASALVLLTGQPALTTGGRWAVAILAAIVADCAVVQFYAARRMR